MVRRAHPAGRTGLSSEGCALPHHLPCHPRCFRAAPRRARRRARSPRPRLAASASPSTARDSWVDGGLGKLRFDDERRAARPRRRPSSPTAARLTADAGACAPWRAPTATAPARSLDLDEAYLELRPVPRSAWRLLRPRRRLPCAASRSRTPASAGPRPTPLSYSAVNSWFGEELRTLGVDLQAHPRRRARRLAARPRRAARRLPRQRPRRRPARPGAAGRSATARRGSSSGCRWRRCPPSVPTAASSSSRRRSKSPSTRSTAAPATTPARSGTTSTARGCGCSTTTTAATRWWPRNGQWAWRTEFDHLGWHLRLPRGSEVIAQAMDGETEMDGFDGPFVYADFGAGFLLLSHAWGRQRGQPALRRLLGRRPRPRSPATPTTRTATPGRRPGS